MRRLRSLSLVTVVLVAALALSAPASAETYLPNAGTLGPIPDGTTATWESFGASRNVTFTVAGLPNQITNVEVGLTLSPAHGWAGDLDVVLIAPNATSHVIFSHTGSTTATGFGDSSDVAGPYTFTDLAAAPPSGGWWQAANVAIATSPIAAGTYRTTVAGGAAVPNPAPATLMTPVFATTDPNGTWTLRFRDAAMSDTGTVSAASLTITAVDTIAPDTAFSKKPKPRTKKHRAAFAFVSTEIGSTFECKLGKKAYKPCGATKTFTKVKVGPHTLRVRAIDPAGNVDPTPAKYSWRVRPSD